MGVPIATISSGDEKLDSTIGLVSVEIQRELNRIPSAKLVLLDGSAAKRTFELSNTAFFEPGKRIEIALRYEGDRRDTTVFEGLVVRHSIEPRPEGSTLRVELKDPAFKLTRQRKSAVFRKESDDGAIRTLIEEAGLKVGTLATTKYEHSELIQYYASDWDFVVSRADVQGLVVDAHRGAISTCAMALGARGNSKIEYGFSELYEIELELDGGQQWAQVSSVGWDLQQQKLSAPQQAKQPELKVGNVNAEAIAKQLGGDTYTLQHSGTLAQGELETWANARLLRSRFALLRGRALVGGNAALEPLDTVELVGFGERFDGKVLVSAVTQRVDLDGWRTELHLGLAPEWFARKPEIAEVAAGGMLPAISSLQIAVVAAFEEDPQGEHRIKLTLPAFDAKHGAVWARVARPDAGKDRGLVFWPEKGDEVVVGFLDGDPRQAIVLGALHSSAKPPPTLAAVPSGANDVRAIVSRAGASIAFDDGKKTIAIETAGDGDKRSKILIDGDQKAITISDAHGNTFTMNDKGITLKSASDFSIEATGKVVIKGGAVDVQ